MSTDDRPHHLLDLIDRLGGLEPDKLLGHFSEENVEALKEAAGLLKEGLELERYLSEKRFIAVTSELRELKDLWSGRLKDTLTMAGLAIDRGEKVQAMWILEGFIRFCPSPYYRRIAERVLERYGED